MAKLSMVCLVLALAVAGHLISGSLAKHKVSHHHHSIVPKPPKCKCWSDLIVKCPQYIAVGKSVSVPTKDCCDMVRKADLPCICKQITPLLEKMINTKKLVLVSSYCGKPLPHGTHCGSVRIPPASAA